MTLTLLAWEIPRGNLAEGSAADTLAAGGMQATAGKGDLGGTLQKPFGMSKQNLLL